MIVVICHPIYLKVRNTEVHTHPVRLIISSDLAIALLSIQSLSACVKCSFVCPTQVSEEDKICRYGVHSVGTELQVPSLPPSDMYLAFPCPACVLSTL